jgi:7-cyano-7-deazaguanine synthase
MAKDLALVLCDGGINSSVAAALAAQRHRLIVLSVDTGSQSAAATEPGSRRRAAYEMLVAHLKPHREHTLAMPFLNWVKRAGSSAASASIDPRAASDLAPRLVELTPLIALAARFASHYAATAIYLGLRVGPDCADLSRVTEYLQIWNELLQLPCGLPELELQMPLLELEPWQVVDLGVQVGCPFDKTWSCDLDHAEPCGVCSGCRFREAAFDQAAKPDPLRKR